MDNYTVAEHFSLLSKLMDIHGENSFKAKNYAVAAFTIEKLPVQLTEMSEGDIFSTRGIGTSTGEKIKELLETGSLDALKEILAKTPAGVTEMLNIKGIGPKKIAVIWREMQIESIGELLYACRENRLKTYKGFGDKTQQSLIETIEYYFNNQGQFLFATVEAIEPQITNYLKSLFGADKVHITGAFLRQLEIIEHLEYLIPLDLIAIKPKFVSANPPEIIKETEVFIIYKLTNGLQLKLYHGSKDWGKKLFELSCSASFFEHCLTVDTQNTFEDVAIHHQHWFKAQQLLYLPPFAREQPNCLKKTQSEIQQIIQPGDIKGIIHSHSNWSDGSNTIEEMALAAKAQGLAYLVISDHSKSAFYANGLNEERIKAQHQQIDELNNKIRDFKIFKSIECDILNDGALDYSNAILSTFDLVITSIHSNLKMIEEKAMMRLLGAIENPYTTILGHMTGRLLLSRKGYPVDHRRIIDACVANNVVIELNAHPSRLDMDWREIGYALERGALISINPDAHHIDGFADTRYGVLVAQKAMVQKHQNLSSFSLKEFTEYLAAKKKPK